MKIPILCPYWGHEHLKIAEFLKQIRTVGYDGVDAWVPEDKREKQTLYNYLDKHSLFFVAHQHRANGATFLKFCSSFKAELALCAEANPVLINSHTGHDYFSNDQLITLIEIAKEFAAKNNVKICHETHRGRFGYSPQMIEAFFNRFPDLEITADFSHWTCVTESMLSNFEEILKVAISRTRAIHARVGFEQGPQITDPRDPAWSYALSSFLKWWDAIVATNIKEGTEILPITTEFGPPPYMAKIPFSNVPLYNQFELNCFMKDLLRERYTHLN
ncbi:sugar phosphate isomerase/epimerase [Pedobacter sp. UYEF25]